MPREPEGRIEAALAKQPRGTVGWRMVVDPGGQHAVTDYRVLGAADGRAWLELRPRTGRTHQIRVHCAALGVPIVGDPAYGGSAGHPLQLHARAIALPLYPAKAADRGHGAGAAAHESRLLTALGYARTDRDVSGTERGGVSEHRLGPPSVPGGCRAVPRNPPRRAGRDPDAFSSTFEEESEKSAVVFRRAAGRSAVFAAFRGPDLLGVAGFYVQPGPKHRHKGTLWGMYVRPQARGAGIGARLVDAVIEHARASCRADRADRHQREPGRAPAISRASGSRNTGSKSAPRNIAAAIMTMC